MKLLYRLAALLTAPDGTPAPIEVADAICGYDGRRRGATLLGICESKREHQRDTTPSVSIALREPRYHLLP